ncbi:MAG: hypothetical protein AB9835_13260 [Eubacteriales bacterium]
MKKKKVSATLLLSALIASLVLSSCGGENAGNSTTAAPSGEQTQTTTAEPKDSLEARMSVSDGLSDADFGGAVIRSIIQVEKLNDMYVESETGEVIDDAIYQRNKAVEERFNVKIEKSMHYNENEYAKISATMQASVKAGDDAYDLYLGHMVQAGGDALQGIFLNWYDIPNTDFSKPWYPQLAIQNLTIDGKMFLGVGDMMLSDAYNTYCMYFDKAQAKNYAIPDLYALVRDGKWTVDKLIEFSKDVYSDLNGDGKPDEGDFYGFSSDLYSNMVTYMWAFNQPIAQVKDDAVEITFNSPKTQSIIDKVRQLITSPGSITKGEHMYGVTKIFATGHSLFTNGYLKNAIDQLRAVESDFGIIPYPKFDEAQEQYRTMVDGNASVMAVPKTAQNLEMIGTVVTALNAEGWKRVIPAFYDVALKIKGARDEESIEMLDIIMNGRVIDFPYVYDNWKGFAFSIQDLVDPKSTKELASLYESKQAAAQKHYDQVLSLFMDYE